MAEVIEINLVCNDKLNFEMLFSFIYEQTEIDASSRVIEVMDNWEYENTYVINSKQDLNSLVSSKIVCITEKAKDGYVGLNIEKIENKFCYTIWFNMEKYDFTSHYLRLIREFIIFLKQIMDNQLVLCAIGKEVVFDYQGDYDKLLDDAHNIDIWICLDDLFDFEKGVYASLLKKFDLSKIDDYWMLIKSNINMVMNN